MVPGAAPVKTRIDSYAWAATGKGALTVSIVARNPGVNQLLTAVFGPHGGGLITCLFVSWAIRSRLSFRDQIEGAFRQDK